MAPRLDTSHFTSQLTSGAPHRYRRQLFQRWNEGSLFVRQVRAIRRAANMYAVVTPGEATRVTLDTAASILRGETKVCAVLDGGCTPMGVSVRLFQPWMLWSCHHRKLC